MLASNAPNSATACTIGTLEEMLKLANSIPRTTPYYRVNAVTYNYIQKQAIPSTSLLGGIPGAAIRLEIDHRVPIGEVWPPEGWTG